MEHTLIKYIPVKRAKRFSRLLGKYYYCFTMMILLLLSTLSCTNVGVDKDTERCDTLKFKYAEHISAYIYDKYTVVNLANPWSKGDNLHTYILVNKEDSTIEENSLPKGTVVYTPIERSVVATAPHCNLLTWIGCLGAISGVFDAEYINNVSINERLASGEIVDCGSSYSPITELIISIKPQAFLMSPFENVDYGNMGRLAIPIIECADYMETSALGRAEWMRFYGLLFGCFDEADSLFNEVVDNYLHIKNVVSSYDTDRLVVTERKTGNVWYCPGGNSSLGQMIKDAGGRYAFADNKNSGSLALSAETVIDKASDADVWLFMYNGARPITRNELLAEYRGYAAIKAFKTCEIYECNATESMYFEEISFRPDYLLRELAQIVHPNSDLSGALRYYKKLEDE